MSASGMSSLRLMTPNLFLALLSHIVTPGSRQVLRSHQPEGLAKGEAQIQAIRRRLAEQGLL
jgi:hypothetical protein